MCDPKEPFYDLPDDYHLPSLDELLSGQPTRTDTHTYQAKDGKWYLTKGMSPEWLEEVLVLLKLSPPNSPWTTDLTPIQEPKDPKKVHRVRKYPI